MRLKSLELKGFKSFANETVIHFNSDVTGVVGPNGSGKSNIVDAVRWVLGEQKSKELRLDKMSSVIFNGTKKRKEAQMASVTLTFENTKNILPVEFNTVSIARILYRSGESEYRLNGVNCRLKDITSMFMDTGIGADSYAIIALNMVEDLLSDREQARRKMFEQAAGISKYKARKHETGLKLEATTADLDRVEDLLFEIEDNLKKLEKQAARTQKYYELKADYKRISIEFAVLNLARYKDTYKDLEAKITKDEDTYRGMEATTRQVEAEVEALRASHVDKETSLGSQQSTVNQLVGQIRTKENDKMMLSQRLSYITQDAEKLSTQIEKAKSQIQSLEIEVEGYQTDLNYETNVEADLDDQLHKAKATLENVRKDHSLLKGNLEDIVKAQQEAEKNIVSLEKQKAVQTNQIENLQREMARTNADIEQQRSEMATIKTQLDEVLKEYDALNKRIVSIESDELRRQEQLQKKEAELQVILQKTADHQRILDAKRNEQKLTKSMVENLEGFPESIKFLSSQKDWAKNCPLLSDLIFVPEAYRVVIENYLEPYLSYYVVPNAEEALKAIKMLHTGQKGRANFFMLDALQTLEPPLTMMPGALKATELVQVDAQYRHLVEFLLGNVLITQEEEMSGDILKEYPDVVLLSKSGSLIRKRFSVSGGSVGLFEGKKIGRKKNLELLEQEIKELEKAELLLNDKLTSTRNEVHELKSADKSASLKKEKEAQSVLAQKKTGLESRLENIANFVRNFDDKAGQDGKSIDELTQSNQEIEKLLLAEQQKANETREKLANVDGSFRDVAEQLSTFSADYNQKNIEYIRQQNKVNTFRQELNFRKNRLEELRQSSEQNKKTIAANEEDRVYVSGEIARLTNELATQYAEKKDREAELNLVEQLYFQARNQIQEQENRLREIFRKQQDLQVHINQLKDKFTDVKFEITAIGERLRVEFGMSVNDIINDEPNPLLNRAELEKEVGALKRKLDTYGEINPMAVEAYNEIKERYDTIAAQRNDILSAKENLLQTMKEIEETATTRFLESFEQVRTNFIEVFRTLFTEEDTADLVLTQPDNPLESDINIIAKPKGKRPQSIAQLSGGEKTLTATALLFALYLLKPAPFCIFDEVDAPLDDANIEKFNKIIRKFSKDSQFIVVTHNKATMVSVDIIYGVYMQEQGVSAVSPVDFRTIGSGESMVFETK